MLNVTAKFEISLHHYLKFMKFVTPTHEKTEPGNSSRMESYFTVVKQGNNSEHRTELPKMQKQITKVGIASKGREESTQKSKITTVNTTRQPTVRRKTSSEITSTVNSFIEETRANVKLSSSPNKHALKQEGVKPKLPTTSREINPKRSVKTVLPISVVNASQVSNESSNTETISLRKSLTSKPQTDGRLDSLQATVPARMIKKASIEGKGSNKTTTSTGATGEKSKLLSGKTGILTGRNAITKDLKETENCTSTQSQGNGKGPQRKLPSTKLLNSYLTSSSSEDEEEYEQPSSPASRAKMWNEIHNSPGPSFPGWKFRPPAHGRRMNKLGPEELSKAFDNLSLKTDGESQTTDPKLNKFSDYMKKMKSISKGTDASTTTAEQNVQLKKMYALQLDAMRQKATASLKALDEETPVTVIPESELKILREGLDRKYQEHRLSSTDLLKNAVETLQHRRIPTRKLPFSSPRTNVREKLEEMGNELAQGDTSSGKVDNERNQQNISPSSFGDNARLKRGSRSSRKKYESEDSGEESEEMRIGAPRENPLQKLKNITKTMGVDKADVPRWSGIQESQYSPTDSDSEDLDLSVEQVKY